MTEGQIAGDDPIGVVFVLPDNNAGGAQRVMLSFAAALDPQKFSVDVIIVCHGGEQVFDLPANVRITQLGATRILRGLPKLIASIRRLQPRILVSVMGYLNLALLAARPLLHDNVRLVIREANVLSATVQILPRWLPARHLYRTLYPFAAAILAPTATIQKQIVDAVPGAKSVAVIPNPVDEATLRRSACPPVRPPGKGRVLVGAGRLTGQKGFDRLIDIMPSLPADARLIVCGEGGDRASLERRVTVLGLTDRVSFPGYRKDLPAVIAGADAFVLPSRWEGLSNVSLESLALGTPVIASEEANLDEVAGALPPGSVTIAPLGPAFASAITAIAPSTPDRETPRPSLLPPRYRLENAVHEFAALLIRMAAEPVH